MDTPEREVVILDRFRCFTPFDEFGVITAQIIAEADVYEAESGDGITVFQMSGRRLTLRAEQSYSLAPAESMPSDYHIAAVPGKIGTEGRVVSYSDTASEYLCSVVSGIISPMLIASATR